MRRTLSSKLTFVLKVIPVCLTATWLLSVLNLYLRYLGAGSFWALIAPLLIAIAVGYCWNLCRLKRLGLDDQFLYVSNYWREVRVPRTAIRQVAECTWNGIAYPVEVLLASASEFGNSVTFMPRIRPGRSNRDNLQVLEELRSAGGTL